MMNGVTEEISKELKRLSDDKVRASGMRFFREEVHLYGVRAAAVNALAARYWKEIRRSGKAEILDLCERLWQSGMQEEAMIACNWSARLTPQFEKDDFRVLERWVFTYVTNWATCDTLCNHTVGDFIQGYPEYISELKRWTGSENRWVRRASAVSLIIPARRGKFLDDIFEIAGLLLTDPDDMVQKGYGWMLKVAAEAHPQRVWEFLMERRAVMPRTAFRYALEKMPPDLRAAAMS